MEKKAADNFLYARYIQHGLSPSPPSCLIPSAVAPVSAFSHLVQMQSFIPIPVNFRVLLSTFVSNHHGALQLRLLR
jgi:hypothetical protein